MKLRKAGALYHAEVAMKPGNGIALSDLEKALEGADREMGGQMGTKYTLDESLELAYVNMVRTAGAPEEAALKVALGKLPGFRSLWTAKNGFGFAFAGDKQPRLSEVRKVAGLEVVDVILGPSKGGLRYKCSTHPEKTSSDPINCPVCQAKMSGVGASMPVGRKKAACAC